jgi:hypothetical protein
VSLVPDDLLRQHGAYGRFPLMCKSHNNEHAYRSRRELPARNKLYNGVYARFQKARILLYNDYGFHTALESEGMLYQDIDVHAQLQLLYNPPKHDYD